MRGRSKAFFINGGAGRVLCSIPALERYAKDSGDKDFVVVCESGMEFYRGHPVLHKHAFEVWHKGLFEHSLKDKDIVSPEPYRVNEYFNQKCSLAQGFDIIINELDELRVLPHPEIDLSKEELVRGYQSLQEIKSATKKNKILIFQPFGRSVQQMGPAVYDSTSRSIEPQNVISIIQALRKEYGIIIMSQTPINLPDDEKHPVAVPQENDLRMWATMIHNADHFLGCDSLGQHIAKALGTTATVVIGSTYPINISYPDDKDFDIIDIGKDKRIYSPIRLTMDDERDRANNDSIIMTDKEIKMVVDTVKKRMGKGTKFEGTVEPHQHTDQCGHNVRNNPEQPIGDASAYTKEAPISIPQGMKLRDEG